MRGLLLFLLYQEGVLGSERVIQVIASSLGNLERGWVWHSKQALSPSQSPQSLLFLRLGPTIKVSVYSVSLWS